MKKQIRTLAALLMALVLPMTACGDIGIVTSDDGPTGIYIGDNTFTIDDEPDDDDEPDEAAAPEESNVPDEAAAPEDPAPEEDPGTSSGNEELPYEEVQAPEEEGPALDEDGTYNSVEDVSLYLYTYNHLPSNYITKSEARDLGWTGGSVEQYAPGYAIGGDKFGNREGVLPAGNYHECDIDTIGGTSRGAKRIVYSDDGRIYYTEDHYETFTLLYGEE